MRRTLYIMEQILFGWPQFLVGLLFFVWHRKESHFWFQNTLVTEWKNSYSISFGFFIFVGKITPRYCGINGVLIHEYGHSIQSMILGPLYIPLIGIPSVLWANLPFLKAWRKKKGISYKAFYTEKNADYLGEKFSLNIKSESCK